MGGRFALIIGNTEYIDSGLAQLTAPGKDAEDLARVLKDQGICAFDDVKVLLNQLSSTVIEVVDEFFDQKKPDDLLVLYFSGHGVRDELGSLYLAVKNTIRTRLRSTAIKSDFIREAMDQSRSKRQVLILDCCNSGAFSQGTKAATGVSIGTASAFEVGYGRIILTASDSTQFAWEGDKVIGETDNSLFTHYLVEGLEGEADLDGDGSITVDELYDYAYEKVKLATPKQTPSKFSSKQQGEIVLRQSMRIEDIKPATLPAALLDSLENPFSDVRLGAVQQLIKLLNGKNLGLARSAREALERIAEEDDSRTVSRAAFQAVEAIRQAEQKAEEERKAREEAERIAILKAEEERLAQEKAEAERIAREAAKQKTEEERVTKAKLESIRLAKAKQLAGKKAEAEQKAKEEAERLLAQQKAEDEQRAKEEEAERLAALKADEEHLVHENGEPERKAGEKSAKTDAKRRIPKLKGEPVSIVYVIVDEGIPLYQSLPASNNWVVWLEQGTRLVLTKASEDTKSIGIFGHYIEVSDEQGNKGYVTATAISIEVAEQKPPPKRTVSEVAQKATNSSRNTVIPQPRQEPFLKWATLGTIGLFVIVTGIWRASYLAGLGPSVPTALPTTETSIPIKETSTIPPTETPTLVPTPLGGGSGRIAFSSSRDELNPDSCGSNCITEIYVMNADGSEQTRLTNNQASDFGPAWSPDGKRIAFASNLDGNYEIYVMNADGSGQTRLTNNQADDYDLAWSPDGNRIAFASNLDGNYEIYVMNIDGSGQTRLTNNQASDFYPAWSPDGKQIAFYSKRDEPNPDSCGSNCNYEIYVMNANGSGQTRLTNNQAKDFGPAWSPDGKQIAFYSKRDEPNSDSCGSNCNYEIYVMNANGSGQTRLTNNQASDFYPAWSPDGKQIAFYSRRDEPNPDSCGNNCNYEIYVMNADGSEQTRLTNNQADDSGPTWQPVGD